MVTEMGFEFYTRTSKQKNYKRERERESRANLVANGWLSTFGEAFQFFPIMRGCKGVDLGPPEPDIRDGKLFL